jgi:VIT1/CCC1 family predicted Fe2+/Mn2+ transporter
MRSTPPHLLDSISRYFLTLFPAFIIVAQLAPIINGSYRNRILRMVLWSVSIGLQIFLVMGFLDWRWIA